MKRASSCGSSCETSPFATHLGNAARILFDRYVPPAAQSELRAAVRAGLDDLRARVDQWDQMCATRSSVNGNPCQAETHQSPSTTNSTTNSPAESRPA